MLAVGGEAHLLSEAWRDPSGIDHTVYAGLVDANGSGLSSQAVALNVNGTAYTQQANQSGCVTLHPALQPGDTSVNMYQVLATFNGTNPRTANLTALDPYGDPYAVCTTNQYDLSRSTNSSMLAVLLQSTDAITAAKTMEQMQKEAGNSGTLKTYGEWSWWFPWYRTHYAYAENGKTMFDMGMSILPFGDSFYGVEEFFQRMVSLFPRIVWSVTSALISGEFFCLLASSSGPWSCAGAFLVSLSMKSLSIMSSFNDIDGLISIFFGIYFPTVYTGLTRGWDMFMTVIQLCEGIKTLAEIGFGRIYRLASFSMNFIFMSLVMQRLKYLGAW